MKVDDKITRMANQIAAFMASRPEAEGIEGFAAHINDFWEPRMRKQLFERLEAGGEGLAPIVLAARDKIRPVPLSEHM